MILLRFVYFLALLVLIAEAKTYIGKHHAQIEQLLAERHADNHKHKRDAEKDDQVKVQPKLTIPEPPPANQSALLARFIVNQIDWAAMGTVSTRNEILNYPTVGLITYSDGPRGNGSGIPYFYLTLRDFSAQDLEKDNRATLIMSLTQTEYCQQKNYAAIDPRCPRVILTGRVERVNNTAEQKLASEGFYARHPHLVGHLRESHSFFLAKLDIESIIVMGGFRGYNQVTPQDYFNPPTNNVADTVLNPSQGGTSTNPNSNTTPSLITSTAI